MPFFDPYGWDPEVSQMPSGSLGNGEAAEVLATLIEGGCDDELRDHLIHFAVRVIPLIMK